MCVLGAGAELKSDVRVVWAGFACGMGRGVPVLGAGAVLESAVLVVEVGVRYRRRPACAWGVRGA